MQSGWRWRRRREIGSLRLLPLRGEECSGGHSAALAQKGRDAQPRDERLALVRAQRSAQGLGGVPRPRTLIVVRRQPRLERREQDTTCPVSRKLLVLGQRVVLSWRSCRDEAKPRDAHRKRFDSTLILARSRVDARQVRIHQLARGATRSRLGTREQVSAHERRARGGCACPRVHSSLVAAHVRDALLPPFRRAALERRLRG